MGAYPPLRCGISYTCTNYMYAISVEPHVYTTIILNTECVITGRLKIHIQNHTLHGSLEKTRDVLYAV